MLTILIVQIPFLFSYEYKNYIIFQLILLEFEFNYMKFSVLENFHISEFVYKFANF